MNHAPTVTPFDLTGPLPTGTTVLEASAGTGKTFTIAALVARWVAEAGVPLPRLLVVTFTRAATAELRDRVRRRLVASADHLGARLRGVSDDPEDELLAHLADASDDELARRHDRLVRAISDVDVATIATIHGFCQHVLDGLGIASDLDRDAELIEDVRELIDEVVDDLLISTYVGQATDRPRLQRGDLVALAETVVRNPTTRLVPTASGHPETGLRLHLAERIRTEVERRARRRRLLSYDDLLTRLDATLRSADRGAAATEALRQRYRITLIDEFQDTDPVQWSIVSNAFADAPERDADDRALVLIGDPKQAIYAFRGADVYAYLDAAAQAHERRTLDTNWRSDAPLLRAFDTLFAGAAFGDEDIPFRRVGAAPGHDAPRLVGAPHDAPLRLRVLPRHERFKRYRKLINAGQARACIAADVAADIVELLDAQPRLVERDAEGSVGEPQPLAPRDIAVLVRNHNEADLVQQALRAVGVPAVVGGSTSVFTTEAAAAWQLLLDALERPASPRNARALALSPWIGWNGDDVARHGEDRWDRLHDDVHRWSALLRERGLATTLRTVMLQRQVQPRLLATDGGDRLLADLAHVGELLHAAASAEQLGVAGLANWLRDRIDEADADPNEERLRRIETDDEAIQILTIHASKGLEFPVVYCPYLWSSNTSVRGLPVFHDERGERVIDVGGDHDDHEGNKQRTEHENRGEELRLLYVAMTRARHRVVAWYAPSGQPEWSGLGRMLLCRHPDGSFDTSREAPILPDEAIRQAIDALAAASDGTIVVEEVPAEPTSAPWTPEDAPTAPLDRARFTRTLDEAWRRTSYSGLTRIEDDTPRVGSEPAEPVKDDEGDLVAVVTASTDDRSRSLRQHELPLAEMPGGTQVGTFVHEVMERTDFAAQDLDAELHEQVTSRLARRGLDLDPAMLVPGLRAAIETPLGPATGGLTLREVTRRHRRDEVEFELPLDHRDGAAPATVADLTALMRAHLPADDPLAGYPDAVPSVLRPRSLRGFLGGSIDLVLRRTRDGEGAVFHVADHKTNRLGTWGEPLTAWDYRPEALADAMVHGHYPIQALLYAVALHRTLRWRLPDYDPDTHLGSVLYLFLRGMAGADTPVVDGQPCGVFAWDVPAALVVAASDLLHGKAVA